MREQSSVKLPVKQADEVVPANVKVKPINAELIIEQEKALKAAGPATASKPTPQPPKDTTADYRIGLGDILNITIWGTTRN